MEPERHLPLAPRDLLVLSVLAEGPLHGYGIIKAVEARSRTGVLLDPANLYRVLRRMRRSGWIREASPTELQEAANGKGGGSVSAETRGGEGHSDGRRRIYEITAAGQTLLAAEIARLEHLLTHVRPALADGEGS